MVLGVSTLVPNFFNQCSTVYSSNRYGYYVTRYQPYSTLRTVFVYSVRNVNGLRTGDVFVVFVDVEKKDMHKTKK